uniref:ELMO domain containing 2 n=1 Tax=Felis catus TaxID=9685 RepID=A0ABI7VSB9_FELCA
MFISLWEFFYGHFFRFWMKWLLRQMTGKCELQRIFDTYVGAQRTHRIENSLTYSKNKDTISQSNYQKLWKNLKRNSETSCSVSPCVTIVTITVTTVLVTDFTNGILCVVKLCQIYVGPYIRFYFLRTLVPWPNL